MVERQLRIRIDPRLQQSNSPYRCIPNVPAINRFLDDIHMPQTEQPLTISFKKENLRQTPSAGEFDPDFNTVNVHTAWTFRDYKLRRGIQKLLHRNTESLDTAYLTTHPSATLGHELQHAADFARNPDGYDSTYRWYYAAMTLGGALIAAVNRNDILLHPSVGSISHFAFNTAFGVLAGRMTYYYLGDPFEKSARRAGKMVKNNPDLYPLVTIQPAKRN